MRIRIKFRKYGTMRFVGHLDLLRYFQRAIRRAGIDIAYSEGYNPHPQLSFALPLGIGLTSDGEYIDLTVNETQPSYDAIRALNREMVEGVEITEYRVLPDQAKKAMASVAAADYIVYFKHREDFTQEEISEGIRAYYSQRSEIPVTKKTKRSERVLDLKPLIYQFKPYSDDRDDSVTLCGFPPRASSVTELSARRGYFLRLCAGSTDNIRPELVLADFYPFLGREYDPGNLQIHRLELYAASEGGFLPLYKLGERVI